MWGVCVSESNSVEPVLSSTFIRALMIILRWSGFCAKHVGGAKQLGGVPIQFLTSGTPACSRGASVFHFCYG